ncbi:MAG: Hsp20/alpha crystallin family protein [Clostridia bacterium]|nr:Hsp20/alpha crystallin family protein [Clostridia bacterium]
MRMVPFHSNDLFGDFDLSDPFKGLFKTLDSLPRVPNVMNTDVMEKDGNIELIMDLPGVSKENIEIKLEEGNLIISASTSGSKSTEEQSDTRNYIRKERHSGKYTRSFFIGENITTDDIKAKFENGTLSLTFPKDKPDEEPKSNIVNID